MKKPKLQKLCSDLAPIVFTLSRIPPRFRLFSAIMAPKAAPIRAPYVDMIQAALVALNDRNGSTLPALKKKIGECRSSCHNLLVWLFRFFT